MPLKNNAKETEKNHGSEKKKTNLYEKRRNPSRRFESIQIESKLY